MALFCSLGGVSYGVATGFIDSREIKNNTIRAKDIRNGQVTSADLRNDNVGGADVNESSLGKVPSATSADSAAKATKAGSADHAALATNAASATNALSVGGVRERAINVRQNAGTPFGPVFSFGGLVIEMECAPFGTDGNVSYGIDTTLAHTEAVVSGFYNTGASGNLEEHAAPTNFGPGDLGGSLGPGTDSIGGGLFGRYEVNYVAPSGSVVTASFAVSETTNALGGSADCILHGHARQSG
jgi:hypothetical protein